MKIEFPDEMPIFDGASMVVRFVAQVDDKPVVCEISSAALEDFFGAPSSLEADLLSAFETGRKRIHAVCRSALERNAGEPMLLRSGLFRVEQASRS